MPTNAKKPAEIEDAGTENRDAVKNVLAEAAGKPAVDRRTTAGVWVHYRNEKTRSDSPDGPLDIQTPVAISLHADQLASRTAAMDADIPGKVVFVPWDGSIEDALK